MAQHHFTRTPPANRQKIADAPAYDQVARARAMVQEAVRIEDRPGKQPISIMPCHQLAPVQVSGENQVEAGVAGSLPYARVVGTEHTNMTLVVRRCVRARDRDHASEMRHAADAVMDPVPAPLRHRIANGVQAELTVVVTADRKNRCRLVQAGNQIAELAQLGTLIDQIATEQHHVRIAEPDRVDDLPAQRAGTATPEVDVAHIQQPARVVSRREALFADVQGVI